MSFWKNIDLPENKGLIFESTVDHVDGKLFRTSVRVMNDDESETFATGKQMQLLVPWDQSKFKKQDFENSDVLGLIK